MEITVIEPQGYCAGVTNAINIAYKARKDYPNKEVIVKWDEINKIGEDVILVNTI